MAIQDNGGAAKQSEDIPDLTNDPQDKPDAPGKPAPTDEMPSVGPTTPTDMPPEVPGDLDPDDKPPTITPFPDEPGGTEDIPLLDDQDKN